MILLVRHCSALGQDAEAELSESGKLQSEQLAIQLASFFNVTKIVSSPFKRAIDTVKPLANMFNLEIECDELLRERYFQKLEPEACTDMNEIFAKLRYSFDDFDFKACEDGESNADCQGRAKKFLQNHQKSAGTTVIVSHGNFITTLLGLNAEKKTFGYEEMCSLSNPDVFILNFDLDSRELVSFDRIWNKSISGLDVKDRVSSRAVVFNPSKDSVLLFHLYNKDTLCKGKAAKSIWITPGGGVEPGEDLISCLERELEEELGLVPSDYTFKGHLWHSAPKPTIYKNRPFLFIDNYFLIRLNSKCNWFDFSRWTEEEKTVLKNLKWWRLAELKKTCDLVVPPQLRSFDVSILDNPIELTAINEDI
jgi:2,3-bisphosphoglycerate-dependent phosphoglycerate mutase